MPGNPVDVGEFMVVANFDAGPCERFCCIGKVADQSQSLSVAAVMAVWAVDDFDTGLFYFNTRAFDA